jgi:hypothetical protein
MEVVFELLFEVVGQLLIELVFNLGFRGVGKLLSNRFVRVVLGIGVGGAVAYVGGWWWGDRLSEVGRTEAPSSLYVSIGLAVAFGALALLRAAKGPRDDSFHVSVGDLLEEPGDSLQLLSPVHWSAWRLLAFSLINVAVAFGISAGFTPDGVRVLG